MAERITDRDEKIEALKAICLRFLPKHMDAFDDNAPMYNVAGQRVTKSMKGIIIQNGRKYVRK